MFAFLEDITEHFPKCECKKSQLKFKFRATGIEGENYYFKNRWDIE